MVPECLISVAILRARHKEPLVNFYKNISIYGLELYLEMQGWHSGESARLPPRCAGFDSRAWRQMNVEFVVDSRPYPADFSLGFPVFLPPENLTLKFPIRIGNGATSFPALLISVTLTK